VPYSPEILTFYNLSGYVLSDIKITFYELLFKYGAHLGFFLFDNKEKYKFIGPFDYENPQKIILNTKLLIRNISSSYENFTTHIPDAIKEGKYEYMKNSISIDVIIPPFYEKDNIMSGIDKVCENKYKYPISIYYRKEINDIIEGEYRKIGEIKPINKP